MSGVLIFHSEALTVKEVRGERGLMLMAGRWSERVSPQSSEGSGSVIVPSSSYRYPGWSNQKNREMQP